MTSIQYAENLLANNWQTDITGRIQSVPQPEIVRESSEEWRQMDVQSRDYVVITDGGISEHTPKSFGWMEEDVTARVEFDVRTMESRERLWGVRDANNDAERYGGLTGEIKRILDSVRAGDKEFSLVNTYEINDLSGQMGGHVWRASVTVRLEQRSAEIDPSP